MSLKNKSLLVTLACGTLVACGKDRGAGAGIPLVEPPVAEATPSGLTAASLLSSYSLFALDLTEVKSRFFSTSPTEVSNLLAGIDSRLTEINTRSAETARACLSATPVEDTLTIFGESVTAKFQCYDVFGDNTGGMMFGKDGSTWYLYQNSGAMRSLVKVTPVEGSTDDYLVDAWMSVGQNNASSSSCNGGTWYGCSYGVIRLRAESAAKTFEMTVAGSGFGYTGAHLKSDGTKLYVKGAASGGTSNGSTWSYTAADTTCVKASDLSAESDCSAISGSNLSLTTLGVTGHTDFGTGITLNGTTSDSVHFGRSVEELSTLSGVSAF
jgi:hypothetical protein